MDNLSNGNIIATIKRAPNNTWSFKARGYYTYNTKTAMMINKHVV